MKQLSILLFVFFVCCKEDYKCPPFNSIPSNVSHKKILLDYWIEMSKCEFDTITQKLLAANKLTRNGDTIFYSLFNLTVTEEFASLSPASTIRMILTPSFNEEMKLQTLELELLPNSYSSYGKIEYLSGLESVIDLYKVKYGQPIKASEFGETKVWEDSIKIIKISSGRYALVGETTGIDKLGFPQAKEIRAPLGAWIQYSSRKFEIANQATSDSLEQEKIKLLDSINKNQIDAI